MIWCTLYRALEFTNEIVEYFLLLEQPLNFIFSLIFFSIDQMLRSRRHILLASYFRSRTDAVFVASLQISSSVLIWRISSSITFLVSY